MKQTMQLSYQALSKKVGAAAFQRGREVFKEDRVLMAEPQDDGDEEWLVYGEVVGSHNEIYEQTIEWTPRDDASQRFKSFSSECSCPVGEDCKHVVAVLLSLCENADLVIRKRFDAVPNAPVRPHNLSEQAAKNWLGTLLSQMPQAEDKPPSEQVVYFLRDTKHPEQRRLLTDLSVTALSSKRRVDGSGWTKAARLGYDTERDIGRSADAPRNLTIYGLLKALSPRTYQFERASLKGELGLTALYKILETERFFLESESKTRPQDILTLGVTAQLNWDWSKLADAWQLNWALQPIVGDVLEDDVALYPGPPALYLDRKRHQIGLVDIGSVPHSQLVQFFMAPALPEAMIQTYEGALMRLLAGLPLPPTMKSIETISGENPHAHLYLSVVPSRERRLRGYVQVQLDFEYATHQFTAATYAKEQPQIFMPKQQGRVLLVRDASAEWQWMTRLRSFGLTRESTGQWVLAQPDQSVVWLDALATDFEHLRQDGFILHIESAVNELVQTTDDIQIVMQDQAGAAKHPKDGSGGVQNQWFDLSLGVDIGGVRTDILPWLPRILDVMANAPIDEEGNPDLPQSIYLPQSDEAAGFVRLNITPLHPWLSALLDLVGDRKRDFEEGGSLKLSRLEALRVGSAIDMSDLGAGAAWEGLGQLKQMFEQLKGQTALPEVPVPLGLQADLRPYQRLGLNWLQFLRAYGLNGVLADDMGLGKTLQTLAHILVERQSGRMTHPVLVVAPVSLMGNWRREAERFTPQLKVLVFHGTDRHEHGETLAQHDVVLTSYALLHRERERWLAHPWHMLVLDEAQNIKNANTHAAQTVGELQTAHRVCLSGTPMENHLGELWSLFHFLMPGFLGSQAKFAKLFRTPIEKHGDNNRMTQLRQRVTPFMLRRNKSEVAGELPPKVEIVTRVKLEGKQADLYETIRLTTEKKVREALATNGLAKSQITILDALLKLRQVCCDPRLVPLAKAKAIKQSAKLEQLMEMIPEMLQEGRKILLFSQFTSMLELIEEVLKARGIPWVKLTGQSTKRDALIERFTSGEVPLFLISLKAGGVGLNLPQADTVIHYDPWWNPAVENQATDRAHRIGQTQTVFVYKMVAEGTIEERILALQERKAALAQSMYSGSVGRKQPLFTEGDVMDLLKPLA